MIRTTGGRAAIVDSRSRMHGFADCSEPDAQRRLAARSLDTGRTARQPLLDAQPAALRRSPPVAELLLHLLGLPPLAALPAAALLARSALAGRLAGARLRLAGPSPCLRLAAAVRPCPSPSAGRALRLAPARSDVRQHLRVEHDLVALLQALLDLGHASRCSRRRSIVALLRAVRRHDEALALLAHVRRADDGLDRHGQHVLQRCRR